MIERDRLFLGHALEAITAIEEFTTDGRANFLIDRKTQSAVVRQIEIVGETVENLSPELTGSQSAIPWRQIAGTRDRLIHAYFKVDLEADWSMIEQDLPPLKRIVENLLGTQRGP